MVDWSGRCRSNLARAGPHDWLGNVAVVKDGLRFYGSGRDGMWVGFSQDGASWELEAGQGQRGGDPGVVQTKAGRFLRVYTGEVRVFRPGPDGGEVLPQSLDALS
jgi:hypothetical protein